MDDTRASLAIVLLGCMGSVALIALAMYGFTGQTPPPALGYVAIAAVGGLLGMTPGPRNGGNHQ